jgi:hypothetical protein
VGQKKTERQIGRYSKRTTMNQEICRVRHGQEERARNAIRSEDREARDRWEERCKKVKTGDKEGEIDLKFENFAVRKGDCGEGEVEETQETDKGKN